jgi:hypothetical protein
MQWQVPTNAIGELIQLLVDVLLVEWLGTFFEVLLFDVIGGVLNGIFGPQRWGFDNPLAFGLFLIFLATATGVVFYNTKIK